MGKRHNTLNDTIFRNSKYIEVINKQVGCKDFKNFCQDEDNKDFKGQYDFMLDTFKTLILLNNCFYSDSNLSIADKVANALDIMEAYLYIDTDKKIDYMVNKVINLRIFDDNKGVMNLSVKDIHGTILSVSQFTLYGDASKGNRPSYIKALNGNEAIRLYDYFNDQLNKVIPTKTGVFGAEMEVSLINDGPITILLEK